jgi:hypothetical protein
VAAPPRGSRVTRGYARPGRKLGKTPPAFAFRKTYPQGTRSGLWTEAVDEARGKICPAFSPAHPVDYILAGQRQCWGWPGAAFHSVIHWLRTSWQQVSNKLSTGPCWHCPGGHARMSEPDVRCVW